MGNTMARILIVDDSPTEMYKLTGMLEKHGHEVLKAENGADLVKNPNVKTVAWLDATLASPAAIRSLAII